MKLYEEVEMYEKKIFRAREQAAFLRYTLESVDRAIELKKQKLGEDITAYNLRAKRDQEILDMHESNIAGWTKKLDKLYGKQLKSIDKEKVEVIVEKSEKEVRKEALKAKKIALAEELQKAKDQLELIKATQELDKEEAAEVIEDIVEEVAEEVFEEDFTVEIETNSNKIECPECKGMFTKGGAFAAHYKSHFNGE